MLGSKFVNEYSVHYRLLSIRKAIIKYFDNEYYEHAGGLSIGLVRSNM